MEQQDGITTNNDSGNKSPSSQNPFESLSDAINKVPENFNHQGLSDSETLSLNPSGNPFLVPETQFSSSLNKQNLAPSSSSPASIVLGEDSVSNSKSTSFPRSASDCSDDDFPISSMPAPESAIQNPPLQVMKRAEEPITPSAYRIPSHVFDRTNTNTPEWSTASNESLFSIHMGNMSFSRELNWLNSEMNMSGPLPPLNNSDNSNGGFTSNQSQVTKFNDISQSAGNFQEGDAVTEAKAAETMREVIMETAEDYDLASVSVASRVDGPSSNFHEHSHHSDGSTKSFAFKVKPEGDKSLRSPKGARSKQQMQPETETPKETSKASQTPKSTSNASCRWLCCFACCIK